MKTPIPIGDRMKSYEAQSETRLDPLLPIIARVDGRGFSRLTASMEKPDERFTRCINETARFLVKETHAAFAYAQSDEITLALMPRGGVSQVFFDGRVQKLASVVASMATVAFNRALLASEDTAQYAAKMPLFDCRVYQVPEPYEVANAVLWRVRDANKNGISMVARDRLGHSAIEGKSSAERREMLTATGFDYNTLPDEFRNGSFWRKEVVQREVDVEAKYRPHQGTVARNEICRVAMPDQIGFAEIAALIGIEATSRSAVSA